MNTAVNVMGIPDMNMLYCMGMMNMNMMYGMSCNNNNNNIDINHKYIAANNNGVNIIYDSSSGYDSAVSELTESDYSDAESCHDQDMELETEMSMAMDEMDMNMMMCEPIVMSSTFSLSSASLDDHDLDESIDYLMECNSQYDDCTWYSVVNKIISEEMGTKRKMVSFETNKNINSNSNNQIVNNKRSRVF